MSYDQARGNCKHCDKDVLVQRKGTNHVLHLILTVLTLGLWSVIWVLASIKIGGWRCSICGSIAKRYFF